MINRDDYLLELPNLKIDETDISRLLHLIDDLSVYWTAWSDEKIRAVENKEDWGRSIDWGSWLNYTGSLYEFPIIKEITSRFPKSLTSRLGNITCSIMKLKSDSVFDVHADLLADGVTPVRIAVLMIPITKNPDPIFFADSCEPDHSIILEHSYTCPTIVNALAWHGVRNDSDSDRITLQFGIGPKGLLGDSKSNWTEVFDLFNRSGLA